MRFRRHRRERGSDLVEMGVALPLFMLLVGGVFVIGSVYNHQMMLNTAARNGARLSAVGHDDSTVLSEIKRLTPNLNHDPARFEVILSRDAAAARCQITYTEKVGFPVLSLLFNNKKLVARAEHRFESEWIER